MAFSRSPRQAGFLCASHKLRATRMRRQVSLINAAPMSGLSWSLFFAGMAVLHRGCKLTFRPRLTEASEIGSGKTIRPYRTPVFNRTFTLKQSGHDEIAHLLKSHHAYQCPIF